MRIHNGFRVLAVLIATCGAVGSGFAAPVVNQVSGTVSPNQSITITGSGFGAKAQAAPLLWDNFESGNVGSLIRDSNASIGRWDSGSGDAYVRYSNSRARTGTKSSLHDFKQSFNASLAKNGSFPTLYMDFWVNVSLVDRRSRNWKVWRLYGDNDRLQLSSVYLCDSPVIAVEDASSGYAKNYWNGNQYTADKWQHVQVVFRQSSPGQADGTVRQYVDSVVMGVNGSNVLTRNSSSVFNQIRLGHYWATDSVDNCASNSGASVYIDDVYIDTSWARVEIGNASTYSQSTLREILVPSQWSSDRITVTVPASSFAAGQAAYIFVTDSNNVTQSVGYPVTMGGSNVVPLPPSSVAVQ